MEDNVIVTREGEGGEICIWWRLLGFGNAIQTHEFANQGEHILIDDIRLI
jgi:hypothetical protein